MGLAIQEDLAFAPALALAQLVADREISPVELTELYLTRIERLNPTLNAFITVASDYAMDAARTAEATLGNDLPPFHGVPIGIKDLSDTAGIRTTCGTAAWAERVPDTDDGIVTKIKQAGFVILGKTNTPEFGLLNITEPPAYGPCRNPWDTERSPGGSSGGAASGLAAGLMPVAHGSDAGGSIRVPSSVCGLYGIKPSRGRVSASPRAQSITWQGGPIARTVADAAAFLDAISGYTTGDAWWAPPPERPFLDEVGRDPGRLRIAFTSESTVDGIEVAPGNCAVVEDTAKLLAELGHTVEEAAPRWDPDRMTRGPLIFAAELAARPDMPDPQTMDPFVRALFEFGKLVQTTDYIQAVDATHRMNRELVAFFDTYDVLLTPTVGRPPPRIGELAGFDNILQAMPVLLAFTPFTDAWNVTGQPAASLPLGTDELGLPVGAQLVGRPADEATLIRLSAQVEQARPWADRRPPVS